MKKSKKSKETKKKMGTHVEIVKTTKKSTSDVEFVRKGRLTKFAPVLAEVETLKINETLEVALDTQEPKSVSNTRNWLAALVKKLPTPKGARFVVKTTTDKKLGITCEKAD